MYGESHVTVRQALSKAALSAQRVRLTVARKAHTVNLFMPRPEKSLPIAYSILAASDDRMIKVLKMHHARDNWNFTKTLWISGQVRYVHSIGTR